MRLYGCMFPWHRDLARDGSRPGSERLTVRKLFWMICDADGMTSDGECSLPIAYLTVVPELDFTPVRVFYTEISVAQKIVPQHRANISQQMSLTISKNVKNIHNTIHLSNPPSPTQY